MKLDRRAFIAGAGALLGCTVGGLRYVNAQQRTTPFTRTHFDAIIDRLMSEQGRFACTYTREDAEGPFYLPGSMRRRDIREGSAGMRLRLGIRVGAVPPRGWPLVECRPLAGAVVDLWQADGEGVYSNVGENLLQRDTIGRTFLRGYQVTDEHGYAEFDTVVPGWEVMAVPPPIGVFLLPPHIHVKVFYDSEVFTTQLHFPNDFVDGLYASVEPYRSRRVMTAPGLTRDYERVGNAEGVRPVSIERDGAGVVAKVAIGVVESFANSTGAPALFR